MAKWFKFEEKRPRYNCYILIWANEPRVAIWDSLSETYAWRYPEDSIFEKPEFDHWQYAPKGPKEER